ncbi:penicillin-binding protein 2 [Candidatus Saccharibacteria bacterium]|nr:penicillin-binding protein 2 [Candidatus Saccharibacteria bacterium]
MSTKKVRFSCLKMIVVGLFLVAVARLFYVQIIQHGRYAAEASETHMKQFTLTAKRGEVYFSNRDGETSPAILNERTWTIFVDPSYVKDKEKVEEKLTDILGKKMELEWKEIWKDMTRGYVEVAKGVDYKTMMAVKEADLRGVGRKETSRRIYPAKNLASQVLGFVNAEGVGTGIEGAMNKRLEGSDGLLKTVTDVNDIPLSIGDENIEIPAKNGENVVLSIDENVQRKVEKVLATTMYNNSGIRSASAIVMNPNNGQIYAMANYPTFNPELYYKETDANVYVNRTTENAYEPASVCKPFTYAMALNEGKLSPDDTYKNEGKTTVADRVIRNASTSMNMHLGKINFRTALDYSFNTGSVEVLRRMGDGAISKDARRTMYDYLYNRFGLGRETGVELYEATGKIISPEETEGNAVRYANMTFGQGMNLTMVQVAAGFASIVNGGQYYQPTIVAGKLEDGKMIPAGAPETKRQTISAETSATMREMLREVRSKNGGEYDKEGYYVGIKTGTAETYDAKGNYTSDRTVAGAIGFGGVADENAMPQYVVIVRLDGDTLLWGSQNAVPVFTQISNYMLEYLRLAPRR